jgi:hypothetical protein
MGAKHLASQPSSMPYVCQWEGANSTYMPNKGHFVSDNKANVK